MGRRGECLTKKVKNLKNYKHIRKEGISHNCLHHANTHKRAEKVTNKNLVKNIQNKGRKKNREMVQWIMAGSSDVQGCTSMFSILNTIDLLSLKKSKRSWSDISFWNQMCCQKPTVFAYFTDCSHFVDKYDIFIVYIYIYI